MRGAEKDSNQIIPELTDKSLVDDTNVESSLCDIGVLKTVEVSRYILVGRIYAKRLCIQAN